jgi:Abortive infection alpha
MNNEIDESAKAAQEVAKTARTGIEATRQLGSFVSRIVNEPVETIVGILDDRLKSMRAERQLRLADRWRDVLKERKIDGPLRIVSPKLALPIIENAALEEDDELQDLWANLLASAVDPNFKGTIRSAFIEIIKQLEVVDVHILNAIFDEARREDYKDKDAFTNYLLKNLVSPNHIANKLNISLEVYETSIDNLLRVRCVSSNVEYQRYSRTDSYAGSRGDLLNHADYDLVCLTPLGVSLVAACTGR